jgi:antitoxin ChpS
MLDPQPGPRYTLKELLAQCDPTTQPTEEEREWLDDNPVGGELI